MGARRPSSLELVQRQVQLEDVDALLADEAEEAAIGVLIDQVEHLPPAAAALPSNTTRLDPRVGDRDVGVEPRARGRDRVDRDARVGPEAVELAVGLDPR